MKNTKTKKEQMLKFVQRFHPLCMSINKIELPDYDSEEGDAYSYYIADAIFIASDPSIPINNYAASKKVKLKIDKKHFDYWLSEQNSVEIIMIY